MATVEERLLAMEQQLATVERQMRWWKGAAGLLLLVGLLLGYPQLGQAQGTVESRLAVLEGKLARVFVANGGADIIISGANLNIINGAGSTQTANGLGNLILGYNEARGGGADFRTGSHNLVIGQRSNYTSFGGIIGGFENQISGPFAHVLTGYQNGALNFYSCVVTGQFNNAANNLALVAGGGANTATGPMSSVTGGFANTASGMQSAVSGGSGNTASGELAVVSGGDSNTASGPFSSVTGGTLNQAGAGFSTVGGGRSEIIGNTDADGFDWRAANTLLADAP
jgi:hypothetical protein